MKLTEAMLKKLSKAELIKIILDTNKISDESPKEKPAPDSQMAQSKTQKRIMKVIDYTDVPFDGGWLPGKKPSPRRKSTEQDYACSRCAKTFKAPAGMFVKDRNEPLCDRCIVHGTPRG